MTKRPTEPPFELRWALRDGKHNAHARMPSREVLELEGWYVVGQSPIYPHVVLMRHDEALAPSMPRGGEGQADGKKAT